MDNDVLVKVTARAWSLKILALMHSGIPGRQASLLSASGAGRTAFAQSLRHLVDLGLMERNLGHGHPLRPEYRLTQTGAEVARIAGKIADVTLQPCEYGLLRRAWTVPVLVASRDPRSFTQIRTELLPITDRALSQSLKQLQARHWIQRKIDIESRPLRPLYQAANAGAWISQAVTSEFR